MKITVSNIIEIQEPTPLLINYCKEHLTFKNPEYQKKMHMGLWVGKTPKQICLYDYNTNTKSLYLPIGCLEDIKSVYPIDNDYRCFKTISDHFKSCSIIPRDYQKHVLDVLKTHNNGIFIAPTGLGKTQMALMLINELKTKTLFVTHTTDLMNQAHSRCVKYLDCKTSFISDGKVDLSGDIVFATVQTLCKKLEEIPQDTFGCYIQDELHHLCQNADNISMFKQCLDYFVAKYKFGCTATLHRADGLHNTIPKLIGNIMYEISEDVKTNEYVGYLDRKEVIRFDKTKYQVLAHVNYVSTDFQLTYNDNGIQRYRDVFDKSGMTISFAKLINELSLDKNRNNLLKSIVISTKGSTIVLSDRVEQLEQLHTMIPNSIVITGKTKKKDREQGLKDVGDGKIRVLLSSYQLAKEGLDLPILENLVMATPVKDETVVIQSVGRIQRPYGDKKIANVYDLIDNVSTLDRFYRKRNSIYKKKNWL
jgi:superfamily II DNA or RNA helicase